MLGGVDATGPHLFTIHPHGSTDKLPYVTMGSGSLAAMAVFERGWRVMTATGTEELRNFVKPNERVKERVYRFRRGTTAWKTENVRDLVVSESVRMVGGDEMDTS